MKSLVTSALALVPLFVGVSCQVFLDCVQTLLTKNFSPLFNFRVGTQARFSTLSLGPSRFTIPPALFVFYIRCNNDFVMWYGVLCSFKEIFSPYVMSLSYSLPYYD